jgi:serine/threonine-protein kinase RsbW/sigma-B regulation protein RsbU (phosphoserine phosphatase)
MLQHETRIASCRTEFRQVVALLDAFGRAHRLPAAVVNDIHVVLDEALSNIVAYGYETEGRGVITVRLARRNDDVRIEVEDDGKAFDPLQAPPPDLAADLSDRQVGGLGIHFIRELMDAVSYRRHEGKNRLCMIKRVHAEARSPRLTTPPGSDVAIVAPQGRIDTANAEGFSERIEALLRGGARHLLIDLGDIIYVSSAGFRALLIARKRINAIDGTIVLCGLSPYLARLFEIAHFTRLFVICATRDEGLARAR